MSASFPAIIPGRDNDKLSFHASNDDLYNSLLILKVFLRFGRILCTETLRDVKEGEELKCQVSEIILQYGKLLFLYVKEVVSNTKANPSC
jgi:hypothetical protein